MNDDVYKAPDSELVTEEIKVSELASRWDRLWAAIIDGLTVSVVTLPAMYFTGGFDDISSGAQPPLTYALAMGALGIVAFFAINFRFLLRDGQTIGKKVLGIRIVEFGTYRRVSGPKILARYACYFLPGQIPGPGQLFSTVNILFIFGKSKRCIHDYCAGTMVVDK